jgi:hypothetical protein
MTNVIELLIKKAGDSKNAIDALQFTQAALNAANALCSLKAAGQSIDKKMN